MGRTDRSRWVRLAAGWLLVLGWVAAAQAQEPVDWRELGRQLAERFELKPLDQTPDWAREDLEPLATVVQLTDIHHRALPDANLQAALDYCQQTLRPDAIWLTGDNVSGPTVARHQELAELLAGAGSPVFVVNGDNDARNFTEVFGTADYALSIAGVRFLTIALDADSEGDGIGTLDLETLRFVADDLRAHADQPALLLIHEPVWPPTFLSAPALLAVLLASPNVTAVLSGHLHYDLDVDGPVRQLCAPAIGPSEGHGIKAYRIYADGIIVCTYERRDGGEYAHSGKWQWLPFPAGLSADPEAGVEATGRSAMPARATRFPEALEAMGDRMRALIDGR